MTGLLAFPGSCDQVDAGPSAAGGVDQLSGLQGKGMRRVSHLQASLSSSFSSDFSLACLPLTQDVRGSDIETSATRQAQVP